MWTLLDNRELSARWHWITCAAPAGMQPGQFVMVRCSAPTSADPWLRQMCWVAQAHADTTTLLVDTQSAGGPWLAAQRPGALLDVLGPLGSAWMPGQRPQTLLALAEGTAVAALVAIIERVVAQGGAALLLTSAPHAERLPPFVLPPEVEYLATDDDVLSLLEAAPRSLDSPLLWADTIVAAGSAALAARLAQRIRRDRFNWAAGLAHFTFNQPLACGVGLCGGCWHETRQGWRLLCHAGPWFDLKTLL